ncbi:MAG: efflux RND transporter permease subunit [Synechococcales cyanobacterium]
MFSEFFIRRPIFATVCSLIIVLLGAVSIPNLPTDYYPQVSPPQVTVVANYSGASAPVVETAVTNVLEQQINGVQGMRYISSTSSNDGTSNITVTFEASRNPDNAAIDVQNRVSQVLSQLPEAVVQNGVTVTKSGGSSFLMFIGMSSAQGEYDTLFISNYTDLYIRDALRRIRGVSDVQIFGERKYAMRLWLDPQKLAGRQLTADDVVQAIREQNIQVAAGQVGRPPTANNLDYQFSILAEGRLQDPEEFAQVIIRTGEDGTLVRVGDVGRVELGAENYDSSFRINGKDAVGIGISKLVDANALDVARAIRQQMDELSRTFPAGLTYDIPYDTTLFIVESVREVIITLLIAIFLVVFTIFIFLQNWRTTFIPAITIPIALIGTFAFMNVLGFSINTLTMFGLTLATGIVVDDAIVVVENISRYIEDGMNPLEASIVSMRELSGAVIATSLVLVAVFVPVAFFPGTTGQIYQQFALTIVASITISTFNALTMAPALSALLIRGESAMPFFLLQWFSRLIDGTTQIYQSLLAGLMRTRALIIVLFVAVLGFTGWFYGRVPTSFVPIEDQGYFINIVFGPPGTSLSYTDRIIDQATQIMLSNPEIEATVGVGGFSFGGSAPNTGLIFGALKPWSERRGAGQGAGDIVNRLQGPLLGGITGALVIPLNPPPIQGLGSAGGFTMQLQDRGVNDFQVLQQTSLGLFFASQQVPPLQVNFPTFSANDPQLQVSVDRDRAGLLGVPLNSVFGTLQTLLGGTYVNNFDLNNRNYRVYVQGDHGFRSSPETINQFYVRSDRDEMVPLSTLVQVEQITGPSIISHYNLFRSVEIAGEAKPGFSSGQALNALQGLAAQILPSGMGYEWTGITLEEIEAGGQALFIFTMGIVFAYLVLAAQYESYVDPFIIMLAVPLAILGALLAVTLRGFSNDIFCQVGLVMLIGLASKNSILIVEFANQLHQQGIPLIKAAIQASALRFRAILMTAFSFILGTFPLLIAEGAGAASRQSLGTTVFGGLLVATVLSLVMVPVLFVVVKSIEQAVFVRRSPS